MIFGRFRSFRSSPAEIGTRLVRFSPWKNHFSQICLDLICDWVDEEPYLRPAIENLMKSRTENVDQLSDSELIAVDIIQGLVRMNVLPRIR